MKKFSKIEKRSVLALLMVVILLILFFPNIVSASYAYNADNYESAGMNFMLGQYYAREISYSEVSAEDSIDLYDDESNVTAKILIINRDDFIDYVVLDFRADRIDEFGFDQSEFINLFYDKEQIMYAGTLNYAYYDNGQLKDIYGDNISEAVYLAEMREFKASFDLDPGDSGYDGILNWNELEIDVETSGNEIAEGGEIIRRAHAFVDGVTESGVSNLIQFTSSNVYNSMYELREGVTINDTCVATALTNLCLYYDALEMYPGLIVEDKYETFISIIDYIDFFDWNGDWETKTINGMTFYIGDQGYDCEPIYYGETSWTTVRRVINDGRPLLSAIYKAQAGENFYHAVLILGYDSYQYQYTYSGRVNSEMYYYLRISDGWDTSSAGKYIDFNGFYRSVEAIDLIISN